MEPLLYGAATSAVQIEGATRADGRGRSIWDRFWDTPGAVRNGETGELACDFYHRYRDDLDLAAELGVDAFRFSVAWPRVIPDGGRRVNERGLDFYDHLVDELLARSLEPVLTLYHWDLPLPLEDAGGWPSRRTVDAFVRFSEAVVGRLGDRVRYWITQNEPRVPGFLGYGTGEHAPGRRSRADALAAVHHLLLAHARAVPVIRAGAPDAQVGISIDPTLASPASGRLADVLAARRVDGERIRWYLDPLFGRGYPDDLLELYGPDAPPVRRHDLDDIAVPIDFLGINFYERQVVGAGPGGEPRVVHQDGSRYTEMGWEVSPGALAGVIARIDDEYSPRSFWVTENGAAFDDVRTHDGSGHDPERAEYVRDHVRAVQLARLAGHPVDAYFVWSLLDNFEWALGYSKRFGLVFVDYPTLERVPKQSFHAFREEIARSRAQAAAAR